MKKVDALMCAKQFHVGTESCATLRTWQKSIQNWQILHGYISRILENFAPKPGSFTKSERFLFVVVVGFSLLI
jgi:hypothetical protein